MAFFKKKIFNIIIVLPLLFLVDRLSKNFILDFFENSLTTYIKLTSFLNIVLVWNSGIGFGLFSSENQILYNLFTAIIVIINLIIFYLSYVETKIKSFLLMIILGGSLRNLFDRLYYNAVPDFIDLNYAGYHWFVFNVADIFITFGILCLILNEFINYNLKNEKN